MLRSLLPPDRDGNILVYVGDDPDPDSRLPWDVMLSGMLPVDEGKLENAVLGGDLIGVIQNTAAIPFCAP